MSKIVSVFILSLILASCVNSSNTTTNKIKYEKVERSDNSPFIESKRSIEQSKEVIKSEEWICDTILSLDEVKKESEFIQKQSKGKRYLSAGIYTYPNATDTYYWVKVWEDNGNSFTTHFNFYVYPRSRKIMFYDTVKDIHTQRYPHDNLLY